MLVRTIHQEWELWKWLAIISLAAALSLAFASVVGATDKSNPDRPPDLLPSEIKDWANPMPVVVSEGDDLGCQVWKVLELHRIQNHDAAIAVWNELDLPPETEVWKWIALGHALTATERFEQAGEFLDRAIQSQPDNAIAFFVRGVLRLREAQFAWDWPEDFYVPGTRLVTFPNRIVPNTKAMYELAASLDFERAIELAWNFRPDETIVPGRFPTLAALEPTVGDLLIALGAEKFEAKAHSALGRLFLERGSLELAEQHLDAAVQGGLDVVYGYCDLGDEYRACGRHADAMRAYLKEMKVSGHKMRPLFDAIRSLKDALTPQ